MWSDTLQKSAKSLFYSESCRIFAMSKGNNDIPETSINSKFNNLKFKDYETE